MALTVADVLALPELVVGSPQTLVGGPGLHRPVRWVHVSEVADVAGTLTGGELILSTGMAFADSRFDPTAYVESLGDAGAVGLVVEAGLHVQRVPDPLVRAARAAALPLVELRRTIRFVSITHAVHALLLHEQYARLDFARRVHETFAALTFDAAPAEEVLQRASELLGCTVVLEDVSHHAVCSAGRTAVGEVLADWGPRSRRVPHTAETAEGGPEGWLTTPVGPVGQRWGRLVVPERTSGRAGGTAARGPVVGTGGDGAAQAALVLERASETLTISRLIDRDQSSMTARAQASLLREILGGSSTSEASLRARARALGLPFRDTLLPLVVQVDEVGVEPRDRGGDPGFPTPPSPGTQDDPAVSTGVVLAGIVARAGLTGLCAPLGDRQVGVLLTTTRAQAPSQLLGRFLRALEAHAQGRRTASWTVASADAVTTLSAAGEGLQEAAHVARVAATSQTSEVRAYRTADLGARGLLWWMREDPRLQRYVERHLGPLLSLPQGRAASHLRVLRAFLAAGGSVTRAARALHLSRPATYSWVDRLQTLLGQDLGDVESRLSLHLALVAHDEATARA